MKVRSPQLAITSRRHTRSLIINNVWKLKANSAECTVFMNTFHPDTACGRLRNNIVDNSYVGCTANLQTTRAHPGQTLRQHREDPLLTATSLGMRAEGVARLSQKN